MIRVAHITVENCKSCPYCIKGITYGNDGRDGKTTHKCKLEIWGGCENFGFGLDENYMKPMKIPEEIPKECGLEFYQKKEDLR